MKHTLTILFFWLLAGISAHAVTFKVTVPAGTKKCYVTGEFNKWSAPGALELNRISNTHFELDIPSLTAEALSGTADGGFKYLARPDWAYVECEADRSEVANRRVATGNDVVSGWKNNPLIIKESINFNSTRREIQLFTPPDYAENPDKHYPVLYMSGIKDRYKIVGTKEVNEDDIFGDQSWAVAKTLEKMYNEGKEVGIVVVIYGHVSELSPWINKDFMGSGHGDNYLNSVINEVMPYINQKYRTLTGPQNTAIAGSDMGGLISYYAALKHQDVFGIAGMFSPSFWFNKAELSAYLNSWHKTTNLKMYFTVGGKEIATLKNDTRDIYEQTKNKGYIPGDIVFETYRDGIHNDLSWGKQFENFYTFLSGGIYTPASKDYRFMSHSDSEGAICEGDAPFLQTTYYPDGSSSTSEEILVYIRTIPTDIKTPYNWNINIGNDCNGTNLLPENKSIGFSSKKSADTWMRVLVYDDKTAEDIEASSKHFRVVKADDEKNGLIMTQCNEDGSAGEEDSYSVSAEVNFTGDNKKFEIHYGSVNSGSDMGSLTGAKGAYPLQVPKDCTKAQIVYSFKTNQVTVKPLQSVTIDYNYRFMSGNQANSISCDPDANLEEIDFFAMGKSDPQKAKVFIKEVPVSEKGDYFWNINIGNDCTGNNLFADNKTVVFSTKKNTISWIRCVVFPSLTSEDVAVSSEHFRAIAGSNEVLMSHSGTGDPYTLSATVDFKTIDKTFAIYYGSVNSGSKMSAVTSTVSLSEKCLQAKIIYCFKTNKVTVEETKWGEPSVEDTDPRPVVSYFRATPSVCKAGIPVTVSALIGNAKGYQFSFKTSHNYGNATSQIHQVDDNGELTFTIKDISSGIYHVSLDAVKDAVKQDNLLTICIKVPFENSKEDVEVQKVINAYDETDWETTGRYKGNFHTHTSQSIDSDFSTNEVVDLYHSKGYQILALTDHDYNSFPWTMFGMFNPQAENRDPDVLNMLTFPSVELSRDNRNNWDDVNGNQFNHHNDFFTGRKGQEFALVEESYALTQKLGGFQIINHPGQYWDLGNTYNNEALQRNSPAWHANNFKKYQSLIGLEVYNQGNRRPNDRILWDQILDRTMPDRPVYGYSCDDTHTREQYFRNYEFMLMNELTLPALQDAMRKGKLYFSYEYEGSGDAKAPRIQSIAVDEDKKTITIDTPDQDVYWISGTDIEDAKGLNSCKSSIVGYGKTFSYDGFLGNYIRALIINKYGETCTQPFGFAFGPISGIEQQIENDKIENADFIVFPNPAQDQTKVVSDSQIEEISLITMSGQVLKSFGGNKQTELELNLQDINGGMYLLKVKTETFTKSKLLNILK